MVNCFWLSIWSLFYSVHAKQAVFWKENMMQKCKQMVVSV